VSYYIRLGRFMRYVSEGKLVRLGSLGGLLDSVG
jgi:hypothetical protein